MFGGNFAWLAWVSAWVVRVSSWLGESGEAAGTPFGGTISLITTKLSAVSLLGVFVLGV